MSNGLWIGYRTILFQLSQYQSSKSPHKFGPCLYFGKFCNLAQWCRLIRGRRHKSVTFAHVMGFIGEVWHLHFVGSLLVHRTNVCCIYRMFMVVEHLEDIKGLAHGHIQDDTNENSSSATVMIWTQQLRSCNTRKALCLQSMMDWYHISSIEAHGGPLLT